MRKETGTRGMSRRNFLSGAGIAAAAVGSAALLGGCAPAAGAASPAAPSGEYAWEDSADIIVIGSGSGLMAAYKAAEAGASVIVLEKRSYFGGETGISGGVIYVGGSSVQAAAGITDKRTGAEDTTESTLTDWKTHAIKGLDDALAKKIVDYGPEIIDWYIEKGLFFALYQSGTDPVDRGHAAHDTAGVEGVTGGAGGLLTQTLQREFEALGGKCFANTRVIEILTDDNLAIVGVKARTAEGKILYYGAKAIVNAAGGPDDNTDLTMKYNPEAIKWTSFGTTVNMGDAFYLVEKLDVNVVGQQNWLDYQAPNPALLAVVNYQPVEEPIVAMTDIYGQTGPRPFIDIDKNGQRFADETKGYPNFLGVDIARQEDGFAWCVTDSGYFTVSDGLIASFYTDTYNLPEEKLVSEGLFVKADTIEELAVQMEIDAALLQKAVTDWNATVASGSDPEFGRPEQTLATIETAPYYAYKLTPGYTVPQGGACISLDVDEHCRCLDRDGQVVSGLYAIGTGAAFLRAYGHGYPGSGSNNAAGLGMGIVAGLHAANFVKGA